MGKHLSQTEFSPKKYFKNAELTLRRMLGSSYQVTKIEYVVRSDLAQRFQRFVPIYSPSHLTYVLCSKFVQFVQQYGDDAGPTMCFHGTNMANLDSILENGLMVPGQVTRQGQQVGVACGSTWGRGIYLAIEPSFSLGYVRAAANRKALIVCSVLLGKSFVCSNPRRGGGLQQGFDSHVSPSGKELVVFSGAQVLPCWLVHFKTTAEIAMRQDPTSGKPLRTTEKREEEMSEKELRNKKRRDKRARRRAREREAKGLDKPKQGQQQQQNK